VDTIVIFRLFRISGTLVALKTPRMLLSTELATAFSFPAKTPPNESTLFWANFNTETALWVRLFL